MVDFGTFYLVDASSNPITVTLPVTTGNAGNYLQLKRTDWVSTNTVTIVTNGSDSSKIDATMSSLPLNPGEFVLLFVDSTESWLRSLEDTSRSSVFGTGADGVATINADTTLSRDMFYLALDITNGAKVNTNGFRLCVLDRLTMTGTGTTIHNNGSDAKGQTAGAGGGGSTPGNAISTVGGGYDGSDGGAGLLAGGSSGNPTVSQPGSVGGTGGGGGSVGITAGGLAGVFTPPTVANGGQGCIANLTNALNARDNSSTQLFAGTGGGGGAANGLSAIGGGGGGAGGIVVLCARSFVCDSNQTCFISAKGGKGADASGSGNAGGGGGGGGGCVIILTRVSNLLANSPGLTVSVVGGGAGNGLGTGTAGSAGSSGLLQVIDRV